ncbi:MAG TPA: hypothetical protein VGE38_01100 [Nocardioides sp.]|uniref:hypothetical protein n=1 Tax=Nocardioides sp. TaxID=35761 RepID=UPI002EDADC4B
MLDSSRDPIQFNPGPHDVRIVQGAHVYYVRAIKRGELFLGGGLAGIEGLVFAATIGVLLHLRNAKDSHWKVGVVRYRRDGSGLIRVAHKEKATSLAGAEALRERLAAKVRAGGFAPERRGTS